MFLAYNKRVTLSDAAPSSDRGCMADSRDKSPSPLYTFYDRYVASGHAAWREDRVDRIVRRLSGEHGALLDVGCGNGRNLLRLREASPGLVLSGTDISESGCATVRELGFDARPADAGEALPFDPDSFDFVLCGEVIEHVVDPDGLLIELRRVLKPGGRLILTTPNLAYAVNRLLLLCGVQPLFTETSLKKNYGRYFSFLGQGRRETQGHLKIFTRRALCELLTDCGFEVLATEGYCFMQSGPTHVIDRAFRRLPGMAAGYIFDARKSLTAGVEDLPHAHVERASSR